MQSLRVVGQLLAQEIVRHQAMQQIPEAQDPHQLILVIDHRDMSEPLSIRVAFLQGPEGILKSIVFPATGVIGQRDKNLSHVIAE